MMALRSVTCRKGLIDEEKSLDDEAKQIVTAEDARRVEGKMEELIESASILGNSIEISTKDENQKLDSRRIFVKYSGYVLRILAIIIAGVVALP